LSDNDEEHCTSSDEDPMTAFSTLPAAAAAEVASLLELTADVERRAFCPGRKLDSTSLAAADFAWTASATFAYVWWTFVAIGITSERDVTDWNSSGGGGNGGGESTTSTPLGDSVSIGVAYIVSAAVLPRGFNVEPPSEYGTMAEYRATLVGRLWMLPYRSKCASESFFTVPLTGRLRRLRNVAAASPTDNCRRQWRYCAANAFSGCLRTPSEYTPANTLQQPASLSATNFQYWHFCAASIVYTVYETGCCPSFCLSIVCPIRPLQRVYCWAPVS